MIKSLEKVSSLSDTPGAPEFRQALSDCQAEIKMAKMIESNFPEFMKVAEETYLLFKSGLELSNKADDVYYDMKEYSVRAQISHVSKSERLSKEGYYLRLRKDYLQHTLVSGEDVKVSGFGKFCVKEKSERKGRNPATGGDMMLAPRKVVTFRCSGELREKVNGER